MRRAVDLLLLIIALPIVHACAPSAKSGGVPSEPPRMADGFDERAPQDRAPPRRTPTDEEIRATDRPSGSGPTTLVVAGDVGPSDAARGGRVAVAAPRGDRACSPNPAVMSCARVRFDSPPPARLALSTSRSGIAVAWTTSPPRNAVYLARTDADLLTKGQTTIGTAGNPYDVAVSTLPNGGYFVAAATSTGLELNRLNEDGSLAAPPRLIVSGNSAFAPYLTARPDGGPLLVFTSENTTYAALLDTSGRELWRTSLFTSPTEPDIASVIYTGNGFLVASRTGGVALKRVELDGSAGPTLNPVGGSSEYPHLAWDGSMAQLSWFDFGQVMGIRWVNVDKNGALQGPVAELGKMPAYSSPSPTAFAGGKRIIVMGGRTGTTGTAATLDITVVSRSGSPLNVPFNLLNRTPTRATCYRAAPLGNTLVVAWLEGASQPGSPANQIGLARVAP